MKIIINERQEALLKEHFLKEAMMDGFSTDELLNINSFKGKLNYCRQMLGEPIGKGSSRVVFQIDDNKILKLAFNSKGIAQNEAECDFNMNNYDVTPTLYEADTDNYVFLISEFVLPAKKDDFKKVLGISFEEYVEFVKRVQSDFSRRRIYTNMSKERWQEIYDSDEWFGWLYSFLADYGFDNADLYRLANYGLANRSWGANIVILDNGLNEEVFSNYYGGRF